MTSRNLYLASVNPGKLREFREAALEYGIRIESAPGLSQRAPCIEDGETFEANACKKALYYAAGVQGLVFADDSGICVDALGGAPGVHSARYAGLQASEEDNNRKLMTELRRAPDSGKTQERPPGSRERIGGFTAHYLCLIALVEDGEVLTVTEGRVDGVIVDSPRGSGGFGYDPYFFYPPFGKTFAEITPEEKFTVSHRGIAFRKLLDYLRRHEG
ncbi:MAG TPA: non-canonical purine NTP pyrophosphatase [Terriglobia bacterium]|nr:non-canonical purine NTP pyrophosphatase [Terriglobia bacterium]